MDVVDVVTVVTVVSWYPMRGEGAIKIWPVREYQTSAGLNMAVPYVKYLNQIKPLWSQYI